MRQMVRSALIFKRLNRVQRLPHLCVVVCAFLLVIQVCEATEPLYISDHSSIGVVEFTDKGPRVNLGPSMQYLIDINKQWQLVDVIGPNADQHFSDMNIDIPSFGLTDETYWLRVALRYEGVEKEVIKDFEIAYPLLERLNFYELDEFGRSRTVLGGMARALAEPGVRSRSFVARMHFTKGETKWI
ncbi:MAG: hypothetical protein JKY67_20105, partial [Pseudomonadales bacterium]|nr:hypothetical protein [Pseudomonadales bacterium]